MTSADLVTVNAIELKGAFDFVSAGAPGEQGAYICMDTGRINWTSIALDVAEEDLRADLAPSDRSIEVLHKDALGLDRDLVLEFAAQELPRAHEAVQDFLRCQGAHGYCKRWRAVHGAREKWCVYEDRATKGALRNWCEETSMRLVEGESRRGAALYRDGVRRHEGDGHG